MVLPSMFAKTFKNVSNVPRHLVSVSRRMRYPLLSCSTVLARQASVAHGAGGRGQKTAPNRAKPRHFGAHQNTIP
jgi:hypothetical protein